MYNGVISKTSPVVDTVTVLTGVWSEYDSGDFHIVKTPFFTVITAILDAKSYPLPFTFSKPVAAILARADGKVEAIVIRPGDTAVSVDAPGVFTLNVFGDQAQLTAAR